MAKEVGVQSENLVVFLSKADAVQDLTTVDSDRRNFFETEIRQLLDEHGFAGQTARVIIGSAQAAIDGKDAELGERSIHQLLDAIDGFKVPNRKNVPGGAKPLSKEK